MFFEEDRIAAVREMILADDEAGRRAALAKIGPFQRRDFQELFEIMAGLPVTIRLLDPPLHEFLPHTDEEIEALAAAAGLDAAKLKRRAAELSETNPMLGWRGCRLGIAFPEIYEMQVRAIFEAACTVAKGGRGADRGGDAPPGGQEGGDRLPAPADRRHGEGGAEGAGRHASTTRSA